MGQWRSTFFLVSCALTSACGASLRTVRSTPAGDAPTVHARDREVAVAYALRWARIPPETRPTRAWRAVVVRDQASPSCPGGARGAACVAACPVDREVPGTDGAVRISERCETYELLGELSPKPAGIDAPSAHRESEVSGSFTEYGARSFVLDAPCTADHRCRVWWTLRVGLTGAPDAESAGYDWREDVPDTHAWPTCSDARIDAANRRAGLPAAGIPVGGACDVRWFSD